MLIPEVEKLIAELNLAWGTNYAKQFALAIQSATAKRCAEMAEQEFVKRMNVCAALSGKGTEVEFERSDAKAAMARFLADAIRKEFQEKPE